MDGREYLTRLADSRGDDVLFGGRIDPTDVPSAMMLVNESVQQYAERYSATSEGYEALVEEETGDAALGVSEVLYELMSESDKLSELTKLVGRLRFAAEGGEAGLAGEAEADIEVLARHLPEEFEIPRLVAFTKSGGALAGRIADLCLQRCFHLAQQEFVKLGQVEREIETLEASDGSTG